MQKLLHAALAAGLLFGHALSHAAQRPTICVQVITAARLPPHGPCVDFPTPCDVPEGWELCAQPSE